MHLNPHSITPILCIILSTILGFVVLFNKPNASLNRIFFFICLNISGWLFIYLPSNFSINEKDLTLWFRYDFVLITFLPVMCSTFISEFLKLPKRIIHSKIILIIACVISFLSLFTDLIIQGVNYLPWHPYPKAGSLHFLLIIFTAYLIISINKSLIIASKQHDLSINNNHIKYIQAGIIILSFGIYDFIANYNIPIYTIGPYTSTIFLIILSIAIIKHQLLDINIVIKKGLVYSLLISALTIIYLITVIIIEKLFDSYIGYRNITNSIITSIIIAIIFIPLRNKIQQIIEHVFFKGTQSEIMALNELLKKEVAQTERLKSIAILASGLAHEIKNPLTPLKTFSEFLPEKIEDKEFLRKFSPIISQEISRIDKLVNQLLEFAKPTPAILKNNNIHNIIDATLDLLSNNLIQKKIHVHKAFAATTFLLPLDQNQIKQALLNILLNAIDSMQNGGTITLTTHNNQPNDSLQIQIKDSGSGINDKDMSHIFDPFFTKKDHGTGLGLSVTYEIIKNHQGKIFVESKKNFGTTFIIELPYNSPLL